jgi:hypothetical protein
MRSSSKFRFSVKTCSVVEKIVPAGSANTDLFNMFVISSISRESLRRRGGDWIGGAGGVEEAAVGGGAGRREEDVEAAAAAAAVAFANFAF